MEGDSRIERTIETPEEQRLQERITILKEGEKNGKI